MAFEMHCIERGRTREEDRRINEENVSRCAKQQILYTVRASIQAKQVTHQRKRTQNTVSINNMKKTANEKKNYSNTMNTEGERKKKQNEIKHITVLQYTFFLSQYSSVTKERQTI